MLGITMLKPLWNFALGRTQKRKPPPGHDPGRRRRTFRPRLEALEDRTVPAAVFWDGGGGDNLWSNALNWSNDQLPTNLDDVTIGGFFQHDVVKHDVPGATVQSLNVFNGDLEVNGLLQTGGFDLAPGSKVTGTGTLKISGVGSWWGGDFLEGMNQGKVEITNTGQLNISGAVAKTLSGWTIDNYGVSTWQGGDTTFKNGGNWKNNVNAVFSLLSDGLLQNEGGLNEKIVNNGVLQKSGGTGTTIIRMDVDNQRTEPEPGVFVPSTVQVNIGTLSLQREGNHTGTFNTLQGATLEFAGGGAGGTHTLREGTEFQGGGWVRVTTAANLLTTPGFAAFVQELALKSGGALSGPGYIIVTGTLHWDGGAIRGGVDLVVAQGAIGQLGDATKTIDGARFTAAGTVDWLGGNIVMKNTAGFVVDGTTFTCRTSASMTGDNTNCTIIVKNGGLFTKDNVAAPDPTLIEKITISLLTGGVFEEEGFDYRPPAP